MTSIDPSLDGYWPSPWPGEDGGPQRLQVPGSSDFVVEEGQLLRATHREVFGGTMTVLRNEGQVYFQGNSMGGPDTTAWVERIDPYTLEPLVRSPDLPGGRFWPGGIAAHRNGSLYVTYGSWCHRLDADSLLPTASRRLPRSRPYNSLVVLPDGHLVMKDFAGGAGVHALPPEDSGSEVVVLEPDGLEIVDRRVLPEGSIARLSTSTDETGGSKLIVVGDRHLLALDWESTPATFGRMSAVPYLCEQGQTFGWDAVVSGGSAWFLDNGEGTTGFGPSLRGKGVSTSPLHLVRVPLREGAMAQHTEVCGLPAGIVANPPVVDAARHLVVGFDSGNGVLAAWHIGDEGAPLQPAWRRDQDHAGHMIQLSRPGLLVTGDFDHERGIDQCVVVDIATGTERARVDTGSPVQSVTFPSPGWHRDLYLTTFTTLTRVAVDDG